MALHAALAAAATLVATAFAFSTLERYRARRKRHELMWTVSLAMFALGSAGLWAGATLGWSEWTFKTFYLFGAILNVPFLALGTVYLLGDQKLGDRCTAVVSLISAFAAGIVVAAPTIGAGGLVMKAIGSREVLPQGQMVFGAGPRIAAATGSGVAAVVIIVGALWSALRLIRPRGVPVPDGAIAPGRLAIANVLIAAGTLVLGSGGVLNSVANAMDAFAITLVVGIALIFAGFLLTSTPAPLPVIEPWYPPTETLALNEPTADDQTPTRPTLIDLADAHRGPPHLN
jgi:hypothetical protein